MKKEIGIISVSLIVVWMIIIFILSATPSEESNGKSKTVIRDIIEKTTVTSNNIAENSIDLKNTISENNKKEKIGEKLNHPFRKCMHAAVYFILAILIYICLKLYKLKTWKCCLFSISISFLYACTDEFHQLHVAGRTGRFIDVLIDNLGAALGIIYIKCIFYIVHKLKKKKEFKPITFSRNKNLFFYL